MEIKVQSAAIRYMVKFLPTSAEFWAGVSGQLSAYHGVKDIHWALTPKNMSVVLHRVNCDVSRIRKDQAAFRRSHRPEVFWRARKVLTQKEMTKM
jgi:hypothetical protein